MPDDTAPPTTGTPAPAESAASPAQPSAPALSPADLAAAEQKGKNAAYAEARRWAESEVAKATAKNDKPAQQSPPQSAPSTGGLTEADVARMVARESDFVRSVTEAKMSGPQEALLRDLFAAQKPPDVKAWFAEKAAAFGTVQQPAVQTASTQSTNMPSTPVHPATVTPAPVATVPSDIPDNPMSWTPAQTEAYIAKNFPKPDDPSHPKNDAARRKLADMSRQQLGPMRLTFR
jgi:hypothetical protein